MIEERVNIDKVKFGKFIASRRKAISDNFTQKELAKILHVGTSTIGKIEAGETLPSFDLFIDLADALEMTPGELMMELAERSDTRKVILLPEDKEYVLFPSFLSDSAKDDIKKFVKQKEEEESPGRVLSKLTIETLEQYEELLDAVSNEEERIKIINERDQKLSVYDDILSRLGITLTFELPYTPEYFPRVFTFGFQKNGDSVKNDKSPLFGKPTLQDIIDTHENLPTEEEMAKGAVLAREIESKARSSQNDKQNQVKNAEPN